MMEDKLLSPSEPCLEGSCLKKPASTDKMSNAQVWIMGSLPFPQFPSVPRVAPKSQAQRKFRTLLLYFEPQNHG